MGLLDDLKRQADMVRTHDSLQRSNLQENVRVVDQAMHKTFLYLLELFKQLDVIKPASPVVYQIESVGAIVNLVSRAVWPPSGLYCEVPASASSLKWRVTAYEMRPPTDAERVLLPCALVSSASSSMA